MSRSTRPPVDFEQIIREVKNYSSPMDQKPLEIQAVEGAKEAMTKLIHGLAKRGVDHKKCVFWIHPETKRDLIAGLRTSHQFESVPEAFRGRPILQENTMPENYILFGAPDAIALGGKVYNPLCVAYAQLHDIHPEQKKKFNQKWERFVDMADDIDEQLDIEHNYDSEEDKKKYVRKLWSNSKAKFVAGVPIIKTEKTDD
uniref:Uncharacterized protein n=1 Tax=uncultured virus TaxID=340016 RepID=D5L2H0_9VIRU|nr:conserved hypothetical protein [uncultured virus]